MGKNVVNIHASVGSGNGHATINARITNPEELAAALGGTGGGNGGTTDHRDLSEESRNAPGQHPMAAITGLPAALAAKADAAAVAAALEGKADKEGIAELVAEAAQDAIDAAMDSKADAVHAGRHAAGGPDPVTPAAIGAASQEGVASLESRVEALEAAGPGDGTRDHSLLTEASRSAANQHPQSAITGLEADLEAKADKADLDALEEIVSELQVNGGGTVDHGQLTAASRAAADQHPVEAITGLNALLDAKADAEAVTMALADKADQSALTALSTAIDQKADTSTVESALAGKAEAAAVEALESALAAKADADETDAALKGKADAVHAARHQAGGADPITAAAIGAVDAGHLAADDPHPQYPLKADLAGSLWPALVQAAMLAIYLNPTLGTTPTTD